MLDRFVVHEPGNPYPVGRWFLAWLFWLGACFFLAPVIGSLLPEYFLALFVLLYLFAGWRLSRTIYPQLRIDPYRGATTVPSTLKFKLGLILAWPVKWPSLLTRIWLCQIL